MIQMMLTSDVKVVLKELGRILRIFSYVCLIAAIVPLIFAEYEGCGFLLGTCALGYISSYGLMSIEAEMEPKLRHAMIVAASFRAASPGLIAVPRSVRRRITSDNFCAISSRTP